MKTDIFYWLLNAGVFGSCIGISLILLRKIKFLPRRMVYCLWILPMLRFWLPFGFSNKYSIMALISKYATKTVTINTPNILPDMAATNVFQAAETYFPITYKTNLLENVFNIANAIWLAGFCILVPVVAIMYLLTVKEIKTARHLRDNVYISENVSAPAIYGIIKVKIIIPAYMLKQDISYILMHENTHIKRKDNLFRCVALLTAVLHWYNPLMWFFMKRYFEDLELACDESVISRMTEEMRKEYALALVGASESKTLFTSAFGGVGIKTRIEKIISYRSLSFVSAVALVVFCAVIAITLLTNAEG